MALLRKKDLDTTTYNTQSHIVGLDILRVVALMFDIVQWWKKLKRIYIQNRCVPEILN